MPRFGRFWPSFILIPVIAFLVLAILLLSAPVGVLAHHTPAPPAVTIVGSLQSELGAAGDWDPTATETRLTYDTFDKVWQRTFSVPAGSWEYKVAINDSWDENYGAHAAQNGANIALNLAAPASVKFYYDHETHWVTDNVNSIIATVAGSFQSELGNSGDWDPAGLCSWLQDPDGDGTYGFTATLPAGNYECKVAINESWDENYGAGGVQNGSNIAFTALEGVPIEFRYIAMTHVLTVANNYETIPVTIVGSLQSELGAAGDWDPTATETRLTYDSIDKVWQRTFSVPAGSWEYKVAINDSWDENYGAHAAQNGANIALNLAAPASVKFYYDHETHWVTDNVNSIIATVAGSFQSELGNSGDWDPAGLCSWLQDPDGDGTYGFTATLPAGNYECKVAINESWDENYGAGGVQNGSNIAFTALEGVPIEFRYIATTHVLTVTNADNPAVIGWCRTMWPQAMTVESGALSDRFYGQVYIEGKTSDQGPTDGLTAQFGYGPVGTAPGSASWTWTAAAFHVDAGNNDEYLSHVTVAEPGTYDYCFRFDYWGKPSVYGDLDGPVPSGEVPANPGKLTVTPPAWTLEKTVSPAAQTIMAGQTATFEWTIKVTKNNPDAPEAVLDDDRAPGFPIHLNSTLLFTYTESCTASTDPADYGSDGTYVIHMDNIAKLTWHDLQAQSQATATITCLLKPEIKITKVTADGATAGDGLFILAGEPIAWRYYVQNTGFVPLKNISVSDSKLAAPPVRVSGDNGDGILAPNSTETWLYEAAGTALAGLQENTGACTGQWLDGGGNVLGIASASDTSAYFGSDPGIAISKVTSDGFGNQGDAIGVIPGQTVTWIYTLTNTGNVPLEHVGVADSISTVMPVFDSGDANGNSLLDTNETWIFKASAPASPGWHKNTGTAEGTFTDSAGHTRKSTASDKSSCYGLDAGYVTNSDLSEFGSFFNLIFTPDIRNWPGHYRLTSSNPGQFYYNLCIRSTGSTRTIEIPYPFVTTGATPIHVYTGVTVKDNGQGGIVLVPEAGLQVPVPQQRITLESYGSSKTATIQLEGLPASGFVLVSIHLDYGLEGTSGWTQGGSSNALQDPAFNQPYPKLTNQANYTFRSPGIPDSIATVQNQNIFKNIKGFGGIVLDSGGDGVPNMHIQLWGPDGKLIETMTTDINGWYWSKYVHKGKEAAYRLYFVEGSAWKNGIIVGGAVKFGEWNIVH